MVAQDHQLRIEHNLAILHPEQQAVGREGRTHSLLYEEMKECSGEEESLPGERQYIP